MFIFGGLSTFIRWQSRNRKERIDRYYDSVLQRQKDFSATTSLEEYDQAIQDLQAIRNKAMQQQMSEKREGNDNFRILMAFIDQTHQHIQVRIKRYAQEDM